MSEVIVKVAYDVYGVKEKGVSNLYVIGLEQYVRGLITRVNKAVGEWAE